MIIFLKWSHTWTMSSFSPRLLCVASSQCLKCLTLTSLFCSEHLWKKSWLHQGKELISSEAYYSVVDQTIWNQFLTVLFSISVSTYTSSNCVPYLVFTVRICTKFFCSPNRVSLVCHAPPFVQLLAWGKTAQHLKQTRLKVSYKKKISSSTWLVPTQSCHIWFLSLPFYLCCPLLISLYFLLLLVQIFTILFE